MDPAQKQSVAHIFDSVITGMLITCHRGYGVGGSNATCISIGPKAGGLTLACRECSQSGYQPFKGASAIEFWIRDQNGSSTIPDVQVGLLLLRRNV